jgi:RHS repeat-associated protein
LLTTWKPDRRGNKIGYVYDPHKRLARKRYNEEADGHIAFVYEGQKLVRVENRSQGVSEDHVYGYDAGYRTASEVQGPRGTVRWEYDVRDQVSRMRVDGGPTTDYSYYPDGSMRTITWSLVPGEFKYRYTPEGQYQAVTFPNGQSRNYSYDWAGRLLQLANLHPTAGNLATYTYGYDMNWATGVKTRKGQRTSMTADVPAQGFANALTKYYYDVHYQLTGADYPGAAPFNGEIARWTYDAIGNRTSETVNGVTTLYTYQKVGGNPKNWQRLVSDGIRDLSYDVNGNLLGPVGHTQADGLYDLEDRLAMLENNSFKYDHQSRLVVRITSQGSVENLLDGLESVAARYPPSQQGDVWFLNGAQLDEQLASVSEAVVSMSAVDGIRTVVLWVRSDGTVKEQDAVDVWGGLRGQVEPDHDHNFTGRPRGAEGIYEYRARYFEPRTGRFIQEDPLRFGSGVNLYRYADSSPAMKLDPLGLSTRCDVPAQVSDCLELLFRRSIAHINVVSKPRSWQVIATTRPGRIIAYRTCDVFWGDYLTVLEEYYHALEQWDTRRMTRRSWLKETAKHGYQHNPYEVEARDFANAQYWSLRDCVECGKYPRGVPYPSEADIQP